MKLFLAYLFFGVTTIALGQEKHFEVFFDFNKDVPTENSMVLLNNWMKSSKNIEIVAVSGYCDSIDSNAYNRELANKRIKTVLEIIRGNAIPIKQDLSIYVFGEEFKQSKTQAENRKVIIEYFQKLQSKKEDEASNAPMEAVTIDPEDKVETERITLVEKFEKAKVGDRIAIYNINFMFNSENIELKSEPLLEELLFIMERNPKMVIKIHGHICCNPNPYNTKLSYRRALKIFKYLKENGIQQNRLAYNGVGSNNPIYPIPEKNENERIANRRVEIEIVRK